MHAYRRNEFVGAIGAFQITTWPFKLGAVIGCAIALLECLRIACGAVAELRWNPAKANGSSPLLRRDLPAITTLVFAIAAFFVVILVFGSTPVRIGVFMIVLLLASISIGMPIAFALLCLSFIGIWLIRGDLSVAESSLGITFGNAISSYEFAVVPLFIVMGLLLEKAEVGRDAFRVCSGTLAKGSRCVGHRDRGGECDLRICYGKLNRLRLGVQPDCRAADGRERLHQTVRRRRGGR